MENHQFWALLIIALIAVTLVMSNAAITGYQVETCTDPDGNDPYISETCSDDVFPNEHYDWCNGTDLCEYICESGVCAAYCQGCLHGDCITDPDGRGRCPRPRGECTDSDGDDVCIKGACTDPDGTVHEDECDPVTGNVIEWVCELDIASAEKICVQKIRPCPLGTEPCIDGKCQCACKCPYDPEKCKEEAKVVDWEKCINCDCKCPADGGGGGGGPVGTGCEGCNCKCLRSIYDNRDALDKNFLRWDRCKCNKCVCDLRPTVSGVEREYFCMTIINGEWQRNPNPECTCVCVKPKYLECECEEEQFT